MQQPQDYSNVLDVLQGLWMPPDANGRSSSRAEQSERGSPELCNGGNSSTRSEGRAGKAAMTLLVLLLSLLAVSGEAPASGGLRRVPRRGRRGHAFSRTLSDHSSSSMPHGFYSRSSDGDVFQANLAGVVDAGDGKREPAVLYLYLKGMRHEDSTTFRGFMFLESADHEWYNWGGTGLCMPQVAMEWLPRVFFRSVADRNREWDFQVYKDIMFEEEAEPEQGTKVERKRICIPFPFELSMSNAEALGDFEIHVEGWKNFAYYSPGTIHTPVPPTPASTGPEGLKDVVALLVPFLQPTPQDIANNLLYYYVQYHLQLGFSKFVQYTQSTYIWGFWEDHRLRKLWTEGKLEFVLWDSTAECVGHLKCMQPLMYSHAILAWWGQSVILSLADHDEYLALAHPEKTASVQDLMRNCFDGLPQVNIRRYNVVCGPGQCEWQEQAAGRLQNWQLQENPDPQLVEVDLWRTANDWKHPMEHYTLRSREPFTEDRGKCMVDPDHLGGFNVHYGMVLPGGKRQETAEGILPWGAPIDEECATWLHLVNLFRGRDNRTTHELDTRWHWIFDKVSGYRMQQDSRHGQQNTRHRLF